MTDQNTTLEIVISIAESIIALGVATLICVSVSVGLSCRAKDHYKTRRTTPSSVIVLQKHEVTQ